MILLHVVQVCVPDNQGRVFLPQPLTLSSESISSQGLYLLDDGRFLWMWIGDQMSPYVLVCVCVCVCMSVCVYVCVHIWLYGTS